MESVGDDDDATMKRGKGGRTARCRLGLQGPSQNTPGSKENPWHDVRNKTRTRSSSGISRVLYSQLISGIEGSCVVVEPVGICVS
jgi:hypothetical protein